MAFWKLHDPIKLLEEKLESSLLLNSDLKRTIVNEIQAEIADSFKFAKESNFPDILDWTTVNSHAQSPLADALLREFSSAEFNQNQMDHIPGPY